MGAPIGSSLWRGRKGAVQETKAFLPFWADAAMTSSFSPPFLPKCKSTSSLSATSVLLVLFEDVLVWLLPLTHCCRKMLHVQSCYSQDA